MEIIQDLNKPVDDNSIDINQAKATTQETVEPRPEAPEPTFNSPEPTRQGKKCCCHCGTICIILLALAVALLYVFHFTGIGSKNGKYNPNATAPVVAQDGALKVAYIDTDSLIAKYQYAIDLQKEIEDYQAAKEASYKKQMADFQTKYNNYLKTGDQLTLTQQKSTEESLQKEMQRLQGLEGEYALQIQEKTVNETKKMTQAVYAFIREYNLANQQFDLILAKSFSSSPVLYGNPSMDITNEIVEGLNKEYAEVGRGE